MHIRLKPLGMSATVGLRCMPLYKDIRHAAIAGAKLAKSKLAKSNSGLVQFNAGIGNPYPLLFVSGYSHSASSLSSLRPKPVSATLHIKFPLNKAFMFFNLSP